MNSYTVSPQSTKTSKSAHLVNNNHDVNNNNNNILSVKNHNICWRNVDCVCLDVDSTTVREEVIDELAKFCGVHEIVKQITNRAMSGKLDFRQALAARLNIMKPSLQVIEDFIASKDVDTILSPGIKQLVTKLQRSNVDVHLVSGGFKETIKPVASHLNIPYENVFANQMIHNRLTGEYEGFDTEAYTSSNGGKARVINLLRAENDYKCMVMIGDGFTDFEACPPADAFICFGGVVTRPELRNRSKYFARSFSEIQQFFQENGVF